MESPSVVDDLRTTLFQRIRTSDTLPALPVTSPDKWLLASALQKAIRRGDSELSVGCAEALFKLDPAMLLRRLAGTAMEDVGIGNAHVTAEVIVSTESLTWLHRLGGPRETVGYLLKEMTAATKDRTPDYLLSICQCHPNLERLRSEFAEASLSGLLGVVSDTAEALPTRALAAWYAAGSDRFPADGLPSRSGDLGALFYVLESMGAPPLTLQACRLATRRLRNPHALFVALLSTISFPVGIREIELVSGDALDHIPLIALGGHTRPGKRSLRRWANENGLIRPFLTKHVPPNRWLDAVHIVAFHLEATPCRTLAVWEQSDSLRTLAIEADLHWAGMALAVGAELFSIAEAELAHLNEIRREIMTAPECS